MINKISGISSSCHSQSIHNKEISSEINASENPESSNTITENEDFQNFIFENCRQIYYYISASGQLIWKGPIYKILGYKADDIRFTSWHTLAEIIHPDDRHTFLSNKVNTVRNTQNYCIVYKVLHNTGHYIIIEDSGKIQENSSGEFIQMGIMNDISSRYRVNSILKSRERNGRIIHDLSLVNFRDISMEDMLISCLKVISTHTHWPVARAISLYRGRFEDTSYHSLWYASEPEKYTSLLQISGKADSSTFSRLQIQIMESNVPYIYADTRKMTDIPVLNKAAELGLNHVILFPVYVKDQVAAIIEFYCETIDLGDTFFTSLLKQLGILLSNMLENKIIEDEFEKFLLAIEQNFASVVITNSQGHIVYSNPRFSEITGYAREEVLGKKPGIVKSGIHDITFYNDFWGTISNGQKWIGEITNRRKDGNLYIEQVSVSPLKDQDGVITHYVAVKFDITEKKNWEEELKKAKDLAEQGNRSKSEFLASMSHEIRTPMNAILGFAELLSIKVTDELQASYVDSIRSSGKTLLNLINDVLDLSKIDAGKMTANPEFFDPFHLFKDIEYMFALKAQEKGLNFRIDVDMNLPVSIETDEIRLRQILINLIGNSIKFTENGIVNVTATCAKNYMVNSEQFIDMKLEITDSGIGISEDFQKVMFTPFTQQEGQDNKRYGGTGLGLTITRKLAQLLNAEIYVESKVNVGSKFTLYFSKIRASARVQLNPEISTITPDRIKFHKSRIIVADDVENNRNYIKGILDTTGIEILESKNGLVTYELAKIYMPEVIITDIKMPGMDGFELLKKIKSTPELKHIPVVATTASTSVEDKNKIFKQNFDGILIKPIQVNDVYLELMRLLPHEIIETENVKDITEMVNGVQNISISAVSNEHVQTVKRLLETDLYSVWKSFEEQQPLSDVENFARKCRELGQKYELEILVSYGNRLLSAINNFDIDNMLKTLQEYPKLLNTFKTVN